MWDSQHVALIIGYWEDGETLIVNDPFPYNLAGSRNPYTDAGAEELEDLQYAISYDDFVQELGWSETIMVAPESVSAGNGQDLPHFCCTAMGRFGPFPNPGISEGQMCTAGQFIGQACY